MKGRTYRYFNDALFPFGYGLSYTKFEIGNGKVNKSGKNMVVSVPVKNAGKMAGTEIVQVYIKDLQDTDGPRISLRGFARVDLKPGEEKRPSTSPSPRNPSSSTTRASTQCASNPATTKSTMAIRQETKI